MAKTYKVHPSIGIARLGRSPEWFPGPTTPGMIADTGRTRAGNMTYRDASQRLLSQAAEFWVFEYDDQDPTAEPVLVQLGGQQGVASIEWTVHLANKKAYWFKFAGVTGSADITNPPGFGYAPAPASLRNNHITSSAQRRSKLIVDFGPRTVAAPGGNADVSRASSAGYPFTGPAAGTLSNAVGPADIDALGSLIGQPDGSLTVVPAPGVSASVGGIAIQSFANNKDWFDSTSDGPVRAVLVFADGSRREVDSPAWVVIAPPDFAPAVTNIVTLYDVFLDTAIRHMGLRPDIFLGPSPVTLDDFTSDSPPFNPAYAPSYRDEIYPIISRPGMYRWVQKRVARRHGWSFDALAQTPFVRPDPAHPTPAEIFDRLRRPEDWNNSDDTFMPVLLGDLDNPTWLTLTPTQYHLLRQWTLGNFDAAGWVWPPVAPAPDIPLRAHGLDRASLEATAGGGFYPGIEIGWIAREPRVLMEPFRFRCAPLGANDPLGLDPGAVPDALYPGDVSKRMACPWQADFFKCNTNWWPAQRPDEVVLNPATMTRASWGRGVASHDQLAVDWDRLGVVSEAPGLSGIYIEIDREL